MNNAARFLADRFFLLRPLVLVPALTFFLLGYSEALKLYRGPGPASSKPLYPWLALLSYALLMASVYVTNQITDAETDNANEKLFLIPEGIISKKEAWGIAAGLMLLGMAGSTIYGRTTVILYALSLLLGLAYSVPPVALKRRFPYDLAANAVGYGTLAFVAGWSIVDGPGLRAVAVAQPFALCVAAVFTLTAVHDRKGDDRAGYATTGVRLGPEGGSRLALILVASALPLSFFVHNRFGLAGSAVSLPFFVYACVKRSERSIRVAYRVTSAAFVLLVGIAFPYFLVLVLALMLLARLYYSVRFSLDYPTLAGK
jgi:4-hydroxybenzoate polyprenyltransferase